MSQQAASEVPSAGAVFHAAGSHSQPSLCQQAIVHPVPSLPVPHTDLSPFMPSDVTKAECLIAFAISFSDLGPASYPRDFLQQMLPPQEHNAKAHEPLASIHSAKCLFSQVPSINLLIDLAFYYFWI